MAAMLKAVVAGMLPEGRRSFAFGVFYAGYGGGWLIGQGLRVLVLVTTNEEIRTLHPAVSRPGRCAANIDFTALPADEAAAWLGERGIDAEPDGDARILASLYAELEGFDPAEPQPSVGFAGG